MCHSSCPLADRHNHRHELVADHRQAAAGGCSGHAVYTTRRLQSSVEGELRTARQDESIYAFVSPKVTRQKQSVCAGNTLWARQCDSSGRHTSFSRNETASAGSGRLPATATAIFARLRKFNLVKKFAMKLLRNHTTMLLDWDTVNVLQCLLAQRRRLRHSMMPEQPHRLDCPAAIRVSCSVRPGRMASVQQHTHGVQGDGGGRQASQRACKAVRESPPGGSPVCPAPR